MNSYMLGHYLDSDIIMNYECPKFYCLLGMGFEELQYRGNIRLNVVESLCKNCDQHQYFFVGNNDSSYLHLQFNIDNDTVLDINECQILSCQVPIEINTEKQVFLNKELPPF